MMHENPCLLAALVGLLAGPVFAGAGLNFSLPESLSFAATPSTGPRNASTRLDDRFAYLEVDYAPARLATFTVEQIALGFINAQVEQGLEDADEQQTHYFHTDTKYADDPVRIRVDAVPNAPQAQTTRANVMHAANVLSIKLLVDDHLSGVAFWENYNHRLLYMGVFDNIASPITLQQGLSGFNVTGATTSKKRSSNTQRLSVQELKSNSAILGVANEYPHLELKFYAVGADLHQVGFFTTILQSVFGIGLTDASEELQQAEFSIERLPAWVFAREIPGSTFPLAVYHVLAILEAIARWSVQQGTYREMIYDLYADEELVSTGCVTEPRRLRRWCGGLRRENVDG